MKQKTNYFISKAINILKDISEKSLIIHRLLQLPSASNKHPCPRSPQLLSSSKEETAKNFKFENIR